MGTKSSLAASVVAAIAGGAVTFWYVTTHSPPVTNPPPGPTTLPVPALIATAHLTRRDFPVRLPWTGTVESSATVELTAPMAGRVVEIQAEDQQQIAVGQPVLRLGGPKVTGPLAELAGAVQSLDTQIDLAKQMEQRFKEGVGQHWNTQEQLAAAEQSVLQLVAQRRAAQIHLETFKAQIQIVAPCGGIFTHRLVSVGQEVSAGQTVGEIIDTGHLRIAAALFPPPRTDLRGKPASIRPVGDSILTATVTQVLPQAEPTGAVQIWIEGPQLDAQLHPGQTVGGTVLIQSASAALAVPASALVNDAQERPLVFVKNVGAYKPVYVQLGQVQDGWAEILSGLAADQTVVVQGAYELFYRDFNEKFKVED